MEKMFTNLWIISSLAHKDLEMRSTNVRQNLALIWGQETWTDVIFKVKGIGLILCKTSSFYAQIKD